MNTAIRILLLITLFIIGLTPFVSAGQEGDVIDVPGLGEVSMLELSPEVMDAMVDGDLGASEEQPEGDLDPLVKRDRGFVHPVPEAIVQDAETDLGPRFSETGGHLVEVPWYQEHSEEEQIEQEALRLQIQGSPKAALPQVPPQDVPTGP